MKRKLIVTWCYEGDILDEVVVEASTPEELDQKVRLAAAALWEKYPPGAVVHGVPVD